MSKTDAVELLTVKELADLAKVPVGTVYMWGSRGGGPKRLKVGKYVRFRMSDVLDWLEEQTA